MPRYSPDKEEIYKPVNVKLEQGEIDKVNKILECIDFKIAEILDVIADSNKLDQWKLDNETIDNLRIIKRNIERLAQRIKDPEYKIVEASHFADRIGQAPGALKCLNKRYVEVIESGAKAIEDFKGYTENCLGDEEFLKGELETKEGATIH